MKNEHILYERHKLFFVGTGGGLEWIKTFVSLHERKALSWYLILQVNYVVYNVCAFLASTYFALQILKCLLSQLGCGELICMTKS